MLAFHSQLKSCIVLSANRLLGQSKLGSCSGHRSQAMHHTCRLGRNVDLLPASPSVDDAGLPASRIRPSGRAHYSL